jgi:uncharacterized protein YndB with AHSA1/START domain
MMNNTLIARATITIHAPASKVWEALIDPELIRQFLFGAEVTSDWKEGSPIVYKGVYQGNAYEDKGAVLQAEPEKLLRMTHWSPLSGTTDSPENYHTVGYELVTENGSTRLTITQDNNSSAEEQAQNAGFWQTVLEGIKKLLEG